MHDGFTCTKMIDDQNSNLRYHLGSVLGSDCMPEAPRWAGKYRLAKRSAQRKFRKSLHLPDIVNGARPQYKDYDSF